MNRTPNQILASTLRRTEYRGCYGQATAHGVATHSIQIFAPDTPENRQRFHAAPRNAQGTLIVADFTL